MFAKPAEEVAQRGTSAVQSVTMGGLDVGNQVNDSVSGLLTALGGVTDAASAQAALPKLREITVQIDKVDGLIGQMSAEQRKFLAGLINPAMPKLNELFDKVLAIPGVADLLKPTIEALKTKLAALAA
jgi:hypothetical protein